MLCCWVEDPNSEAFKLRLPRIFDYLWIAEDGMKMQVHVVPFYNQFKCAIFMKLQLLKCFIQFDCGYISKFIVHTDDFVAGL